MNKVLAFMTFVISAACIFASPQIVAQSPQKMSYQAVVHDNQDHLVTNHAIGIKISILQGSPTGTVVYTETQTTTTNTNGLVTIEIGGGTGFSSIDWSDGPYFLKTETDPTGGTSYTISGTSQLLSVPYAIYSKSAGSYNENDPVFTASPSNGITGSNIINWNTAYSWGNHAGLYRLTSWSPAWTDVTGKPAFSAVATSGSYNDLTGKPALFDGSWASLTGKPVTVAGFGITDAMTISHAANGITSGMMTNWTAAFSWGNHATAGYAPGNRTLTINGSSYDLSANRNWTVGTVNSVGLSLPAIFNISGSPVTGNGTLSASFVSQSANLVFASPSGLSGEPLFRSLTSTDIPNLDWSKITTGKPATLSGYGITDGVNTTSNQAIAGNKTFSGTTTVPTPVNATDAATKEYVDALLTKIEFLENLNGFFTDTRDGNRYFTVQIGSQTWMVGNLKYLPAVHSNAEFQTQGNNSLPGYGVYGYNGSDLATAKSQANYTSYGVLYNWFAVNTVNICPTGWHVPTDGDWHTLTYGLGIGVAGGKLKETGTTHWNSPNTGATNEVLFTALPGGSRSNLGSFNDIGNFGCWWTNTESSLNAYLYQMSYNSGDATQSLNSKKRGFSVRCLKD